MADLVTFNEQGWLHEVSVYVMKGDDRGLMLIGHL